MSTPIENVTADLAEWRKAWHAAVEALNYEAATVAMNRIDVLLETRLEIQRREASAAL